MTTPDAWSPAQYERFKAQRSQPFADLLARLPSCAGRVGLDLGCGTGELTRIAHDRLGLQRTLGVDRSAAMLEQAEAFTGPGLTFERRDIESFLLDSPGRFGLVLSNAALQWLPDHPTLFPRVTSLLGEDGVLAVQIPANHDHISHVLAAQLAAEPEFASVIGGWTRQSPVLALERYAELLYGAGLRELDVWCQVYLHELPSWRAVVEWVKGTLLTAYQERMPAALFERFLELYTQRLEFFCEDTSPFLYPFKRFLMVGRQA